MTISSPRSSLFTENTITKVLVCLVIVLSILFIYLQVSQHEFINFDDNEYVTENRLVKKGFTLETIKQAFIVEVASNWHPITILSHMIDGHIHGLNAGPHILTNVLIHLVNSILLLYVIKTATGYFWRAALVAAMFAVHPTHVESVAWISERKDVLSMLFWLLSVLCYLRYVHRPAVKRFLPILIFLALGLMSKPMLVTLPFVLLLFDIWPLKRNKHSGISFLKRYYEKIPLFILTFASCYMTIVYQKSGEAIKSLITYPLHVRIENAIVSYVMYLGKMFWPFRLAVYYPHPGEYNWLQVSASFFILALVTLMAVSSIRKRPWFFWGWFFYLGTLVPVIGIVQVGTQAFADRYTYIPSIGIFIIVVWGSAELLSLYPKKKAVSGLMASIAVILFVLLSRNQTGYWKNSISLFSHTLAVTKNNHLAHNNIGLAIQETGDMQTAIEHYKKSIHIQPHYVLAHNNLGAAMSQTGNEKTAMRHYSYAITMKPGYISPYINIADMLVSNGEYDKAIMYCKKALEFDKTIPELFIVLADAQARTNSNLDAEKNYKKALQLEPDSAEAHNRYGGFLFANNNIPKALFHFKTALDNEPGNSAFKQNVQTAAQAIDHIKNSILKLQENIRMNPDQKAAYYNIACLYSRLNQADESIAWLKKAIEHGYNNWELIKTDHDLERIRNHPGYFRLLHR